ncbi:MULTISPECIES: hypothetical protein [Paenibacillus]|uniref:hypothetical protein n=1 Tax=Paenibacillus TaxID=44249 RepID=UPI00096C769E|nr:hypothetical protein [Paenibacillus odorifer]OME07542.1 hypothetical protein BSK60_31165 [Paenibacillus odorifer]
MSKVDQVKKLFDGKGLIDITIWTDDGEVVKAGVRHVVDYKLDGNHLILPEYGKKGEITEEGVEEVSNNSAKINFRDIDSNLIVLHINKRISKES